MEDIITANNWFDKDMEPDKSGTIPIRKSLAAMRIKD
jgi:hypothetical protein